MSPAGSLPTGTTGCLLPSPVRLHASWLALPLLLLAAAPAPAEEPGEERAPAYVAAIEGTARVDRGGQSETLERGMPLVEGDRVRTDAGRIEVAFPDRTQVYLDRYAEAEIVQAQLLRLVRGRAFVRLTATRDAPERLLIEAPGASVQFLDDGEYRIGVGGDESVEVELAVLSGSAELRGETGSIQLAPGQRARVVDGEAPVENEWFNAGDATALEQWAAEREELWQSGLYASRNYLPSELAVYASTFDRHGSWSHDPTYGYVWYPSVVADWRPYYHGRWHHVPRFGWTWIAHDPWGWPTHHYGRWHIGARGWFWIPARKWGPAWVYWAISPGYVGWCPLGWDGRPVVNIITVHHRHVRSRHHHYRDPYRVWTVIPRDHFGRASVPLVRAHRTILERERPAFVMQHVPPGFAPPRSPVRRTAVERRAAIRHPGFSTMAPRSRADIARPGMSTPSSGYAVPRAGRDDRSPYERALPYMARPDGSRDRSGSYYRRGPSGDAPSRAPGAVPRGPRVRPDSSDGPASRPGYAAPRHRAPSSPGMSRPPDAGRGPGMSGPSRDSSRGASRAVPRGGSGGGARSHGPSSSGASGGGRAVRRHP